MEAKLQMFLINKGATVYKEVLKLVIYFCSGVAHQTDMT